MAEAFVCQAVVEQFQEMLRAKHLGKDLRLNPKLPEGQQVIKGTSVYSARENPICRVAVKQNVEDDSLSELCLFF